MEELLLLPEFPPNYLARPADTMLAKIAYLLLPYVPIAYLGVAFLIAMYATRRLSVRWGAEKAGKAWAMGIVLFLLLVTVPIGNIIIGRAYLYARCYIDGGLHIYRHVELPAQYFNEYGQQQSKPKYGSKGEVFDCFGDRCFRFRTVYTVLAVFPPGSSIIKDVLMYEDAATGELLGESVFYKQKTWASPGRYPAICPEIRSAGSISDIFKPEQE